MLTTTPTLTAPRAAAPRKPTPARRPRPRFWDLLRRTLGGAAW